MINLNKFDELNHKILLKLNEDYNSMNNNIMLEQSEGDPFAETQNPTDRLKKAEFESDKAYQNMKNVKETTADPDVINAVTIKRNQKLIDKKEASTNVTRANQLKLVKEEFDIDDEYIYSLAEEFDNDLENANNQQQKNNGLNKLEQTLKDKKEKIQDDADKKIEIEKDKKEEELDKTKEEQNQKKLELSQESTNNEQKLKNHTDNSIEDLKNSTEHKIENIDRQLNKVEDLKESYDQNLSEGIIKSIKSSIANRKFDKLFKKRSDLELKLAKLDLEYKKAIKKEKYKKADKIKEKMNKIQSILEEIIKKFDKQNDKLVKLGESFDVLNDIDILCENIDLLLNEIDTDLDFLNDAFIENELYLNNKELLEKYYCEPMANNLVNVINEEFAKGESCNTQRVKILLTKLKQYK